MSRSPIENFAVSNGHGRRQPGSAVVARQGNLIVSASETVPYANLRQQLLDLIEEQERPFGLILDDISGGFTLTGRSTPNSYAVQPVTAWRVFADGRPDELVRGIDMIGTPLVTFEKIVAARTPPRSSTASAVPRRLGSGNHCTGPARRGGRGTEEGEENDRPPLPAPPGVSRMASRRMRHERTFLQACGLLAGLLAGPAQADDRVLQAAAEAELERALTMQLPGQPSPISWRTRSSTERSRPPPPCSAN